MDEISGKNNGQMTEDDIRLTLEFKKYLKYRIILNKDFRYKKGMGLYFLMI